ncbi:TorD/DmsD family molecular chaperone [Nitrogeniibacter aestuarii]|uniref:TorD/DmsD family molecular chaperone n=1 Tax=Nitrogeniibacter aestuarii TaxID=2815343 RepID=UPI001E337653|nr:molecular chaperone TorD family protein [Nitrogeniibacter aestuarii]
MNTPHAPEPLNPEALLPAVEPEDADRAGFYGLIAHLMSQAPSRDTLGAISRSPALEADPQLPEAVALAEAWNALRRACHSMTEAQVAAEWSDLFAGTGRPAVLPYASYYLTGFLMEKPLAELRDTLAELGLQREAGNGEPEDHLAGVCEVMRRLIERGDWAAQPRFYERHMQPWVSRCCTELSSLSSARFYAVLADFAHAFFQWEARVLGYDQ